MIVAIFDRPEAGKESGGFILLADGRLLFVTPDEEFEGTDKDGMRIYKATGKPDYSAAFEDADRFTFKKAHFLLAHYGARVVKRFKDGSAAGRQGNSK